MADFFTHSVFISARVISGICSELTTFAVESPTGCINLPEEVLNYMNKNHAASDSLYVLPVQDGNYIYESNEEGHPIREYRGVVTGETIIGANVFKDFMAGLRDFFGGRSGTYESVLREAKDSAMREMAQRAESLGCNAIVGIDLDYETVGQGGSMLMVTCSGTAVII